VDSVQQRADADRAIDYNGGEAVWRIGMGGQVFRGNEKHLTAEDAEEKQEKIKA
jgi:hypothetical protein